MEKVKATINRLIRWAQTRQIEFVKPQILRALPHDPAAFTQGLAYGAGALYESTGTWEASSIRRLCIDTGEVLENLRVKDDFAEGIALANDRLYQLTWTSGRVLEYEISPLRLVDEKKINSEGWGLANYQDQLVVSNGSNLIQMFDFKFHPTRQMSVNRLGLPFRHMNDIEVVGDQLFANIWYTTLIAQIDISRGQLVRIIDCSELWQAESPDTPHNIMNGITHVSSKDSFLVTGKYWKNLFEISLGG